MRQGWGWDPFWMSDELTFQGLNLLNLSNTYFLNCKKKITLTYYVCVCI